MSMTTFVVGIKPPDEKWKKMKAAYESCLDAGVVPPDEVYEFFEGDRPDDYGVVIDMGALWELKKGNRFHPSSSYWNGGDRGEGIEIEIEKLDPDIKIIRFVNSY